jgi:hypothetical protein
MVSVYAHLDPNRDDDVRATWGETRQLLTARMTHAETQESPNQPDGGSDLRFFLWAILGSNQ